jgi:hypothetical protein
MLDLKTQLGDYLEQVVQRVDLEGVLEQRTGTEPVQLIHPRKPPFRRPGWPYAVAAAVVVLLLIGGAAWLSRRSDTPPADAPTPTTAPIDSTTTAAIGETLSVQEFDVESVPLPVIAEAVTPSSIGVATWTVYEGVWTDELDAGLEAAVSSGVADQSPVPEPTLPESIFSADGIVVDVGANFLGATGGLSLHDWMFRVDWVETALRDGGEELRAAAQEGRVGSVVDRVSGSVEILLFANEDAKWNYLDSARHSSDGLPVADDVPFDRISRYQFSTIASEERFALEAVDATTGESVGTITAAFPISDGQFAEGVVTLSDGESVELVEPAWLDVAALHGFNWFHVDVADAFVVYAERDGFTYEGWRSTDGREWESLGSPFPEGYAPQQGVAGAGGWLAYLDDLTESNPPGPDFLHAFSNDGLVWTIIDDVPEICGDIYRIEAGWVCVSNPVGVFTLDVWTSSDGIAWEEVITTGLPSPADLAGESGSGSTMRVGDKLIVIQLTPDARPETRLWVIQW